MTFTTCPTLTPFFRRKSLVRQAVFGLSLSLLAFTAQASRYEEGLMAYAVGNFTQAGADFVAAAEAGDAGAEHMLMRLFEEKKLYAEDLQAETLKWTRKAAEKGVVHAQFSLGKIYAQQPATMKEAVKWFRLAAEQGHPDAYYQLGALFAEGAEGVRADASESRRLYQIAASEFDVFAQKGSADAQYKLARMYQKGQGVRTNMVLALKWMEKSALQGHALAQLNLGRIFALGIDVPQDAHQARYWLQLAVAHGLRDAEVLLSQVQDKDTTVAMVLK